MQHCQRDRQGPPPINGPGFMSVLPPEHDQSAQADIIDVIMSSIKSLQRCLSIHRVVCLVDFFHLYFLSVIQFLYFYSCGVSLKIQLQRKRGKCEMKKRKNFVYIHVYPVSKPNMFCQNSKFPGENINIDANSETPTLQKQL